MLEMLVKGDCCFMLWLISFRIIIKFFPPNPIDCRHSQGYQVAEILRYYKLVAHLIDIIEFMNFLTFWVHDG